MYLLNDSKDILQDRLLESFVDDDKNMDEIVEKISNCKHKQAVSECKKLRILIIRVVGSNITVILKTEYDNV